MTNKVQAIPKAAANKKVRHRRDCSDTIEESSSGEGLLHRRNSRNQHESRKFAMTHLQQHTCQPLRVLVSVTNRWCVLVQWCEITSEFQHYTWRSSGLKNQSAHVIERTVSTELLALDGTSGEPRQGGYAEVRLGEARNSGPAEHERDDEHALTTRVTQFQEAKTPSHEEFRTACRRPSSAARPCSQSSANDAQFPQTYPAALRQQRAFPQCAQCGADPHAYNQTESGLMANMSQKQGGQTLTPESGAWLRLLDRAACVICCTIRPTKVRPIQMVEFV